LTVCTLHLGAHLNGQRGSQPRLEGSYALDIQYIPRVRDGFLRHQPVEPTHSATLIFAGAEVAKG
jgi:hypothetical protein